LKCIGGSKGKTQGGEKIKGAAGAQIGGHKPPKNLGWYEKKEKVHLPRAESSLRRRGASGNSLQGEEGGNGDKKRTSLMVEWCEGDQGGKTQCVSPVGGEAIIFLKGRLDWEGILLLGKGEEKPAWGTPQEKFPGKKGPPGVERPLGGTESPEG